MKMTLMPKLNKIVLLLITFFMLTAVKAEVLPLPSEKAFHFAAYLENPEQLIVEWQVAPGYYLYRDKLKIQADPVKALKKGQIKWPASKNKPDPIRGYFRAYEGRVHLVLPLTKQSQEGLVVTVQYQGCSQAGFCYAPMKKRLQVSYPFSAEGLNRAPLVMVSEAVSHAQEAKAAATEQSLLTDQEAAKAFLGQHALFVTLLCFLGLGLLLAFTPCTLPMIPILSSIILGQKQLTARKSFQLSLAYVLGTSLTYAAAGLVLAWLGSSVQAYFQSPWIISAFSLVFVLLALSMLGVFQFRLGKVWQQRIAALQQRQKSGSYLGVFFMGVLSTLIVSPCVTAPLVGVLAYISETGNLMLGGSALFVLGLGMGLPLLLLGFSAGKYLPKAGPWMEFIQRFFAFLLLGMAIWMLARILPGGVTLFLWACLLILTAIFLFFVEGLSGWSQHLAYLSGGLFVLYALVLFVGVSMNFTSPFYPFEPHDPAGSLLAIRPHLNKSLDFTELRSMEQLDRLLVEARQEGKPVLLDFYADWCESCQILEKVVLSAGEVQNKLRHFVLLRANVTENNAFDRALLKRYHVVAPPTFLFFNRKGQEVMEKRIVGEVDRQLFLARANAI